MTKTHAGSLVALTHTVSRDFANAELTFVQRQPIDLDQAIAQHDAYRTALAKCGANVQEISVNQDCPDGVFIEDSAVVLPELAIICSMGASSRRSEPARVRRSLEKHRSVTQIDLPGTLEGGDVLCVGKRMFVGKSTRTNELGISQLKQIVEPLGWQVEVIEVSGALHLKTAICAINDEQLLVKRDWLKLPKIDGMMLLDVPTSEPWGANLIRIDNHVVLSAKHPRTADLIDQHGVHVHPVDISEFEKAEGGVTCMSLIMESVTENEP